MVTITSLWLAILLSAVIVWVASAVVWMALPHHKKEWKGLSNEDAARNALKGAAPGLYMIPFAHGPEAMKDPALQKKIQEGPLAYVTVRPPGDIAMGPRLVQSFLFYVVVGIVVAYLTGRTLSPGAEYLTVFRVAGTTAWIAYGFALIPESIWFGRPWSSTAKSLGDGLLYALLTGGVFGWRWPDM